MTSPVKEISIHCPKCGHLYKDWYRASINLQLDHFDDHYIDEATSSTCPLCNYKVKHGALIVLPDEIWDMGNKIA